MNKKVIFGVGLIVFIAVAGVLILKNIAPKEQNEKPIVEPNIIKTKEVAKPESGHTRPEERGEDLSLLNTSEDIKILAESKDKIERRKAAKVIGDRFIADTLKLSGTEKETIAKVTSEYLQQSKAKDSQEKAEASQQIIRLWRTTVPTLLKYMDSNEPPVADMAINSLIAMCNEEIIKAFIDLAKTTKNQMTKDMMIMSLKIMKKPQGTSIKDRQGLTQDELTKLYDRLIAPALKELQPAQNP
jgi:hypothetical protein